MEKPGHQTGAESKTQLVEQINSCLHAGDYARAQDLLRGAAAEFPDDAELSELEKRSQDGAKRKAEADRLITQSQELFAQRKSAEAIELLRNAYELDKSNSLARAILANALVEHAHSLVESDWLRAETLTNQALALNPAHPTAKTILSLIVDRKQTSSVEEWVTQASKLQSAGDLFGALAWVAEGLAVHPHNPKLLQIQEAVQRDQDARRRQARRGDLEELRRMQQEINGATDVAAKQALAVRIQTVAAKHWTDGEILSIANALLLRLGLVPQESSSASPRGKSAAVILHVPRARAPEAARAEASRVPPLEVLPSAFVSSQDTAPPVAEGQAAKSPASPSAAPSSAAAPSAPLPDVVPASQVPASQVATTPAVTSPAPPNEVPGPVQPESVPAAITPPSKVLPSRVPPRMLPRGKVRRSTPAPQVAPPQVASVVATEPSTVAKVASPSSRTKQRTKSNSTTLILVSAAAAILLVVATFYFTRKHYAPAVAKSDAAAAAVPSPTESAPAASAPAVSAPAVAAPAQTTPQPSSAASPFPSDTTAETVTPGARSPAESGRNMGTLLVVAGQDHASVFLNGRLQRQLTQAGQLRIPNLDLKDYVVQVSKSGFQDPPQQKIRIRPGEEARLVFNLQPQPLPQPRLASLTIQGGAPGTTVFIDQTPVGGVQPDGTLSVSTVNPGDHTIELRKERFKPRQLKKHFVAGGTISLAAADAALEAAPGELKITFVPADASVAIVKGDLLKTVSSGVPLNLPAGTYTLTARTADRFTRWSTLEVIAGESRTLNLSLLPNGMSKWDDPGAWKQEGDSFTCKGGDFVLYGVVPASGTFVFSAMLARGHFLQWVFNYTDPRNYVLFQMDDKNFYRTVIRNGEKTDEIIVPHKAEKKSVHTLRIRVSPTELVHQIEQGNSWTVLDRWTQPGVNLSLGKFGFYIPGDDQVALSSFAHYADLNLR